jgi:hypothetical protein
MDDAQQLPPATPYTAHPVFASIGDGDSELQLVLAGLSKPVYALSEIISGGPHGRTNTYKNIELGLLPTFVSRGRRYAFKLNYGKYLLSLARIGETEGQRHHLARPENRPAHDPHRLETAA